MLYSQLNGVRPFPESAQHRLESDVIGLILAIETFLREVILRRETTPIFALWSIRLLQDGLRHGGATDLTELCVHLEEQIVQIGENPAGDIPAIELLNITAHLRSRLASQSPEIARRYKAPLMATQALLHCEAES